MASVQKLFPDIALIDLGPNASSRPVCRIDRRHRAPSGCRHSFVQQDPGTRYRGAAGTNPLEVLYAALRIPLPTAFTSDVLWLPPPAAPTPHDPGTGCVGCELAVTSFAFVCRPEPLPMGRRIPYTSYFVHMHSRSTGLLHRGQALDRSLLSISELPRLDSGWRGAGPLLCGHYPPLAH